MMPSLLRNSVWLAAGASLLAAPLAAQTRTAVPARTAPSQAVPAALAEGYVLGPGDVIEVSVLGRDEFRPRVQVQVDGTIQLPYIRTVRAADRTVIQLRDDITRQLRQGGFYTDPVVNISVVTYAARYVTVLGEFGTTGLVPVDRAYRVSEILARAGGAKPTASDDIILRRANGEEMRLPIVALASGGPNEDPYVQPGDKLYIAAAPLFYVYGQVGAPGSYKIEQGMTVRMALARSGGLTDRGSSKRISLYRGGQKIKAVMDMPLQPGDTMYIGERFF